MLRKKWIQRAIYGTLLLVLTVGWLTNDGISNLNKSSSIGVKYWILHLVVFIPLIYQVINNNKVGWSIITALGICYFLWTFYLNLQSQEFEYTILLLLIFACIGLTLYFLYPDQNKPKGGN